jgi:perosamine synthetase
MIPWYQPELGTEEQQLVAEVLNTNFINDGAYTTRFEQELAARVSCKYVIAVTSGTAALFLSLKAFDIGPGDEVIVPSLTFIATANAVSMCGATPILADIDPDTLNICPRSVEALITKRSKAIIPVHVSGRAANIPAIKTLAAQHNLILIEDAAEALMSKNYGQFLGTHGHTGCLSFSPMKTITTGQGGAILTNDARIHDRLRELKDQGRPTRGTGGADNHVSIGFNFKLTNIQAALGLAQLQRLDQRVDRIRRFYEIYSEQLSDVNDVKLIGFNTEAGEVPQWIDCLCSRREQLVTYLRKHKIDCREFWHPLHRQPPYRQEDKDFPISSEAGDQAFWLPSAFSLTDDQVMEVCARVKSFFE